MPENYRKEVIEAIRFVDEVVLTSHPKDPDDMSVCAALEKISRISLPMVETGMVTIYRKLNCQKISCKLVFNSGAGGKIQSSSWLIDKFISSIDKR